MRVLLLAALAVLIAVPSAAQQVGVRASGVYSSVSTSGLSLGEAFGVGAGVFAEVPVAPRLSIVADVGYVQGGAGGDIVQTSPTNPDPLPTTDDFLYRTHALTIAPALSVALQTDDEVQPSLFFGPRLDIKLSERTEIDGESDSTDDFPDTALGLAAGSGIAVGRARLDLRGSYLWGVDSAIRQSALELRLGVTL